MLKQTFYVELFILLYVYNGNTMIVINEIIIFKD